MKATGTFNVDLKPTDYSQQALEGMQLGRMTLDKTFNGDLEATSKGEMLSAMTTTKGSAGYVVIEQVFGSLTGKKGTFILQHFGMMNRGAQRLILEIIPDSGTAELNGISGSMEIKIEEGKHYYELNYQL